MSLRCIPCKTRWPTASGFMAMAKIAAAMSAGISSGAGNQPAHGRGIDNVGFSALCDHAWHESHDAVDHSAKIDTQAEIPIGIGTLRHRPVDGDAGVVA